VKNRLFNDSHAFVPLRITGIQMGLSVSNVLHADWYANSEYALKLLKKKTEQSSNMQNTNLQTIGRKREDKCAYWPRS
jgi:hypothetical protein